MVDTGRQPREDAPLVSAEALRKAEAYVEQEEGPHNKLSGALGTFVTAAAVIMSIFHLYAAYGIMPTHVLRGIHVAFILFLCFLIYPAAKRFRHRVRWWDWLAALEFHGRRTGRHAPDHRRRPVPLWRPRWLGLLPGRGTG